MYQVLARKCRPQNFEELVGQKHVTQTLANAIRNDRLAHAYIFAGLRGTGKTTVARVLAKCLNCEKGPTAEPCGSCVACTEIAESRAIDVLELDAATRTQVDNIRELQEVISYAPARDRYKVLIIDEAHMLSKSAANALLKTLEEPPPRVVFVLATTEIQKLLPTILSRCQVFEFRRVGYGELKDYLTEVAGREGIDIEDKALERVARAGEGSVRDSLSVLERAMAFCGERITDDDILRMLGGVRFEVIERWVRGLAARDTATMLAVLDSLAGEGHDLLHFWSELIAALRDLLLLGASPAAKQTLSRPAEETDALVAAADGLGTEDLTRAFHILADLEPVLKTSSQPRFMFEATLIRLGSLGAVRPIEQVLDEIRSGEIPLAAAGAAPPRPVPSPARPAPRRTPQKKNGAETRTVAPTESVTAGPAAAGPVTDEPKPAASGSLAGSAAELVAAVYDARPMIGSILEGAKAIEVIGDALSIRLPEGMESLANQLQRKENLQVLVEHSKRLFGRPLRIVVDHGDEIAPPEPKPARGAPAAAAARQPASPAPRPRGSRRTAKPDSLIEKAKREPGVGKLLRDFGAQIVDIKPLGTNEGPENDA